ncbi:MAG: hypothetical protein ABUM51_00390, partial [Bacteroidota bacterium]
MRLKLIGMIVCASMAFAGKTYAQGCVAIRSTGGFCSAGKEAQIDTTHKWQFSTNNRYFKSYKHFIGTDEQKQRQTLGTEVINHQYTLDM